jgi:primosomal protein N' (replication factor Y) (superfamily II helicase)
VKTPLIILAVAIPAPLYKTYDYLAPETKATSSYNVGQRVSVEFGHRRVIGIVLEIKSTTDTPIEKLKPALNYDSDPIIFGPTLLNLIKWAATYYCHPIGECLSTSSPTLARRTAALPALESRRWQRTDKAFEGPSNANHQRQILDFIDNSKGGVWQETLKLLKATPKQLAQLEEKGYLSKTDSLEFSTSQTSDSTRQVTLNAAQLKAYEALSQLRAFAAALFEGVTGSGKTEVYIRMVSDCLAQGKQALILIPEINLSPQTYARFQTQLSTPIALVHSGLSDKEKYRSWLMAKSGLANVIIGTRSAIFTPFKKLGLIVVDEEHDSSYKQMDGFHYSARDLAVKRAQLENCPVILGTATPSLESLYNAKQGHYQHVRLSQRAGAGTLPTVQLIDIKSRPLADGCSPPLLLRMREELAAGNQVIVFQNRRGYAPTLMCSGCSQLLLCEHCDARMTVHSYPPHMHCHHCDYKHAIPSSCQHCQCTDFSPIGTGTERIEAGLMQQFPDIDVIRIDRDTIKNQNALNQALAKIHSGKPAIIVGTQMLSKGHDFHHVTLVAVLDADGLFFSADFRAIERGAQQLTQISGRTGRGEKSGQVLVQTRIPEHPLFEHIIAHDYHRCAEIELDERIQCMLPPHGKMISIRAEAKKQSATIESLQKLHTALLEVLPEQNDAQFVGPIEASMARKQGFYRSYLTLINHSPSERSLIQRAIPNALQIAKTRGVRISIDVDPHEYI